MIATRSRCVRSVSDKAPETWPFLWNLSRRESLRVVSGGGVRQRERESAPSTDGDGST
jgi:hypothetical protein